MTPLQAQDQQQNNGDAWSILGVTYDDALSYADSFVAPIRDQVNNVTDTHSRTQGIIEFCRGNDHAFCESLRSRAQMQLSLIVEEQLNLALDTLKNYCERQRAEFDRLCVREVHGFRDQVNAADKELQDIALEASQVNLEMENVVDVLSQLEQRFTTAQQNLDGLQTELNGREKYCRSFIQVIRTSRDEGCVPAQVDSQSVQPVEIEDARVTTMYQDPTSPEETVQGRARAELTAPVVRDAPELAQTRTYVNDAFYSRGGPQETINTSRQVNQDLMTNGVQSVAEIIALARERAGVTEEESCSGGNCSAALKTAPIPLPRPEGLGQQGGTSVAGGSATNSGEDQVTNNYLDGASYGSGGNESGGTTTGTGTGELGSSGSGAGSSASSSSSGGGFDFSKLGGFPSYGNPSTSTSSGNPQGSGHVTSASSPTRYNQGVSLSPSFDEASYNGSGADPSQGKAGTQAATQAQNESTRNGNRATAFGGNNGMGVATGNSNLLGQGGASMGQNNPAAQKNTPALRRTGSKQIYSQKNREQAGGSHGILGRHPASENSKTLDERMAQLKRTNRAQFDPDKYEPKTAAERLALARATGRRLSGHSQGLQEWPKDIRRLEQAGNLDVFGYMNLQYQMQFRK